MPGVRIKFTVLWHVAYRVFMLQQSFKAPEQGSLAKTTIPPEMSPKLRTRNQQLIPNRKCHTRQQRYFNWEREGGVALSESKTSAGKAVDFPCGLQFHCGPGKAQKYSHREHFVLEFYAIPRVVGLYYFSDGSPGRK